MFRVVQKCPYCGKKPWLRPHDHGGLVMGCCRFYAKYSTETETRSAWNDMAARHSVNARAYEPADPGIVTTVSV